MQAKDDDEHMDLLQIALNEHREDDSLMVKVDKCVRLLGRNGDNVAKAANAFFPPLTSSMAISKACSPICSVAARRN